MEQCRGCGKSFKRVSTHIPYCKGSHDHTKSPSSSELNSKERIETREICPKCQQSFKRLASHLPHCKGTFSREVSRMRAESQEQEASHEETCPKCHHNFKRLASHFPHCKGITKEEAFSKSHEGLQRQSSNLSHSKCKPNEEICPQCFQSFKRLSSHLPYCKGNYREEKSPKCHTMFEHLDIHLPHRQESPEEEIYSSCQDKIEEEETCPMCCQHFKRLASHLPYCKKESNEEICPKCNQSFKRLASHLPYCKGKVDEETCSLCLKTFKRLASHLPHCERKQQEQQEEYCPTCNQSFKRLASHLPYCKGKEDEETCPRCLKTFKRLASHLPHCERKQQEENCPTCNQSFERLASHLSYCKGEEDEETCPRCLKTFKRLASHLPHCERKLQDETCSKTRLNPKSLTSQLEEKRDTESACESETYAINNLKKEFLQKLNECETLFKWSIFSAGSHYDRTKTTKIAGDYDFILYPDVKCNAEFCTQTATLGYCKVIVCKDETKLTQMKKLELIKEHHYFSPSKMKEYTFETFERIIKDPSFRQSRRIYRLHRNPSSPAFTILYDAGAGQKLEVDLVPGVHFNGWPRCDAIRNWKPKWQTPQDLAELKQEYFCVAREHANVDEVPDGHMLWRESFSHTEKLLWKHADGERDPPTCRKPVLKTLKSLLSECIDHNTEIKHLSTFYLRTFMLHEFDKFPRDEDWAKCNMSTCLEDTKKRLRNVLNNKVLMNYFVPGHNVLQEVPEKEVAVFIAYLNQSLSPNTMQQK